MFMLAIISVLVGATLGARFNVLILLPAMLFAGLAIAIGGLAYSSSLSSILAALVIALSSLQIGYLAGGVIIYHVVPGAGGARAWARHRAMSGPVQ
jgi:hypothetical protein